METMYYVVSIGLIVLIISVGFRRAWINARGFFNLVK